MKKLILAIATAILVANCSKHEPAVTDYRPPITAAMRAARKAIIEQPDYAALTHPSRRLHPVNIHKLLNSLANDLRHVDVRGCPEDFRLAWIGLVHTLENYQVGPNIGRGVASGAAGAVAIRTGSKEAGDLAAREFEKVTTEGDITLAIQNLETVCMKYGVQPSAEK